MWNPWRHLRNLAHLTVDTCADLPHHVDGLTDGTRIWLRHGLTQAQRRSALAHELIHVERGTQHVDDREEETVERLAARRMIGLDVLADAIVWTGGQVTDETADWCWVDPALLHARLRACTDTERRYLASRMDRLDPTP